MIAKELMNKDVVTVTPDNTVEEVAQILKDKRISGLPVINAQEKLVGIISEGDLVFQQKRINSPVFFALFDGIFQLGQQQFYEEIKKIAAFKVEDLMSKDVISVQPDTDVVEIATTMIENDINRVPVVDNSNKLVGIITRHDIIKNMYTV